jgi:HTH-type transcriptional regulator, transcriptional repressor of NAD biosynthesis genes
MTSANLPQVASVYAEFNRGLIVGKFCPLHLGHELLINSALSQTRELILISYCKPEFPGYERERREAWLEARFPQAHRLVIDDEYLQKEVKRRGLSEAPIIPHNDDSEYAHRIFVGWLCQFILRMQVDAVFTSEDYGDGFAEVLTQYFQRFNSSAKPVRHICVDKSRTLVPISGTVARADVHEHRRFLAPEIYAGFVKRICLLGGESTGKTTMATLIAEKLNTVWVPEFGRELWVQKQGQLQYDDMRKIGETQIEREDETLLKANRWLICDTSPLTTMFYSQVMFNRVDDCLRGMASRNYHFVFLCAPDFDFVQDGTRRDEAFQWQQHQWYLEELNRKCIAFHQLNGDISTRTRTMLAALSIGPA